MGKAKWIIKLVFKLVGTFLLVNMFDFGIRFLLAINVPDAKNKLGVFLFYRPKTNVIITSGILMILISSILLVLLWRKSVIKLLNKRNEKKLITEIEN